MIKREISLGLKKLLKEFHVVTLLGPRQAGKTTLVREELPNYKYSNLEHPEEREFAQTDPKAYLAQFEDRVIIDEIQRVPKLLSYIQVVVDEKKINGQFVLTGSHQLQLNEAITQSLAGRTAILHLLPLSIEELSANNKDEKQFEDYIIKGFMPKIYNQKIRASTFYSNYYQTYIERDVRQLINLKDRSLFEKFFKLFAGRIGQPMNYSSLSNDVGVDIKVIQNWISILEASYIVFKLPPYFKNFGKRIIKSPKYYFIDVGLLTSTLGIKTAEQYRRDPLVGSLYENLVIVEILKALYNKGEIPNIYYFKDSNGNEVDLLVSRNNALTPIEIKLSSTFSQHFLKGLNSFIEAAQSKKGGFIIYNGSNKNLSSDITLLNTQNITKALSS